MLQAWRLTLEESDNIAKQHEGIAEGINTQVRCTLPGRWPHVMLATLIPGHVA